MARKQLRGNQFPENEVIYADGANILTVHDAPSPIVHKLRNYSHIAESRQVPNQWGELAFIPRKKLHQEIRNANPPEMNKMLSATLGTILGK